MGEVVLERSGRLKLSISYPNQVKEAKKSHAEHQVLDP